MIPARRSGRASAAGPRKVHGPGKEMDAAPSPGTNVTVTTIGQRGVTTGNVYPGTPELYEVRLHQPYLIPGRYGSIPVQHVAARLEELRVPDDGQGEMFGP